MPEERAHLERAKHNQEFLDSITGKKFSDWKAIVAFYVAVHLVEALFAKRGIHSRNHESRHQVLKKGYPKLWNQFRPLYGYAVYSRYLCEPASVHKVEEELLKKRLPGVRSLVEQEAAKFGKLR